MGRRELTVMAVLIGIPLGLVMTAANSYLALYAGMTVAAAIPAMVMAVLITRRRASMHEINIIATGASAGESLAAGIAFTMPALIITGVWEQFDYWVTMLVALCGGVLGVLMMIPLRRVFIAQPSEELTYPEGVAAAEVLQTASKGGIGFMDIVWATLFGGLFKFFVHGFVILKGTVEGAVQAGRSVVYGGTDISMALLGVGYIIGLRVAVLVFAGGLLAWGLAIPAYLFLSPLGSDVAPLDAAWTIWDEQIRYLGVGAMLVGGVWSIIQVRSKIFEAIGQVVQNWRENRSEAAAKIAVEDEDLRGKWLLLGVVLCAGLILALYLWQAPNIGVALTSWLVMLVTGFFFVAVSTYIVGLEGSSNNPVSGMIITTLLLCGGMMLLFGLTGNVAILATLIVAGVVCCAAATGGDIAQNLKTGAIIGASPRAMQIIQIVCVITSAISLPFVLKVLHNAYGIGVGLKAPQAKMFGALTEMLFKSDTDVPWLMIGLGIILGIGLVLLDEHFKRKTEGRVRVFVMAVAVGIYLPVSLAVPMVLGGVIKSMRQRKKAEVEGSDRGTLFASGLIAGEAIMAIFLAVPIGMGWKGWCIYPSGWASHNVLSLLFLALGGLMIWRWSRK